MGRNGKLLVFVLCVFVSRITFDVRIKLINQLIHCIQKWNYTCRLFVCKTWSLTLQEEHRVFKNRVLRGTFEPKQRKLLNEEAGPQFLLFVRYYLCDTIEDEMGGACTHMGKVKCKNNFGQKLCREISWNK